MSLVPALGHCTFGASGVGGIFVVSFAVVPLYCVSGVSFVLFPFL